MWYHVPREKTPPRYRATPRTSLSHQGGGPPQCNGGAPRWLKDVTLSPPPTGQSPRVHLAFKMLGDDAPFFQTPDRSHQYTSYEQ